VPERLEAIHVKIGAKQMRLKPKTKHQEKLGAWIVDKKDYQKERMACQEMMEANPEKMEPNPGE
jgi:hypothetical protein